MLEDRAVFDLESFTVHHRVVRLLGSGTDHVEATSDFVCLLQLERAPLGGACEDQPMSRLMKDQ